MAENIKEYGGIEGDESIEAAETNRDAIHEASVAADDNTVYLPEGEWYVGDENAAQFLQPGRDIVDRGASGLSFTGDGPEKTFLIVSPETETSGGLEIQYHWDNPHPNTTWDNLTYDGNQHNLTFETGDDIIDERQRGIDIRTGGDFTFENVRFRNIHENCVHGTSSGGYSMEFDRCSFYHSGIGRHNQQDGSQVGHFIVAGIDADQHLSITNSEFELVSGTVFDLSSGTDSEVTVDNVWASGIGNAFSKINNAGSVDVSRVYFEGNTAALDQELSTDGSGEGNHNGRWFIYRLAGTEGEVPDVTLNDIEAHSLPYHFMEVYRGYNLNVYGGRDGPVAIYDAATISSRDAAFRDAGYSTSEFYFDFGDLSIHHTPGGAFDVADSSGTIETVNRNDTDGLGETGDVTIHNDTVGASAFEPDVPSRDEVGIRTTENDTGEDIDSPIPDVVHAWRFDEGTGSVVADSAGSADGSISGADWKSDEGWVGGHSLEITEDEYVQVDSGQFDVGDEGTLVLTALGSYTDTDDERGYAFAHPDSRENNRLYVKSDNKDADDKWVARVGDSPQVTIGNISSTNRLRLGVTWKDGEITTYLNGVKQTTGSYTVGLNLNRLDWFFGAWRDDHQHIDGQIDNILLSRTAASEDQMEQDFKDQPWMTDDDGTEEWPLFEDWTPQWASTTDDWSVVSGPEYEGEHALTFEHDGDDRTVYAISWDSVGEPSDVEVLDRFRVPQFTPEEGLGFHARLHLRSSIENGSVIGYWIEVEDREDAFRLGRYTEGNMSTLGHFGTPEEDTFFYRRFRAEGDQLKAKAWRADESEPDGWDIEVTDDALSEGWVGLGSFDTELVETDVFSVGTNGESAPLPESDRPPSVSWVTPNNEETVSGSVTLQIDASDPDDEDDSLPVEYRIDDGPWLSAFYNSETGYYEDTWDSTAFADGDYRLEALVTDSAGNTSRDAVEVTVENEEEVDLTIETVGTRGVTESAATLVGELTSLDGVDEATVAFEWRESGTDSWYTTSGQSLDSVGEFSEDLSGLESDIEYEFRAITTDPEKRAGNTLTFSTEESEDEENAAPTIEQFDIEDKSNPVWSRFDVDWTVSHPEGELDTVVTKLRYQGATVAAESTSVSGEEASFSHVVRVRGDVDEVRLSVNDTDNNVTSETKDV